MDNKKENKFEITIENGIGLIIVGILLQILGGIALFIIPALLIVFGVFQIVKGQANEGIPNIIIAGIIILISQIAKGIINWVGGAIIVIGVVVLIIALIQKNKKKQEKTEV
jgi:hypothetical protein